MRRTIPGRLAWLAVVVVLAACSSSPPGRGGGDRERASAIPAPGAAAAPEGEVAPGAEGTVGTPDVSPPEPEPPRFDGRIARIDGPLRQELIGRNWRPGCPVSLADLRVLTIDHWDFDGTERTGPLVVHERVAVDVLGVFRQLFRAGFRIHKIALPRRYRPPRPEDWFSTRNVTAGFNCRPATENPGSLSQHSYGWAIDINPLQNPYVRGDGTVLRRAAAPFRDRTRHRRGMIHPDDLVVRAFAAIGWEWGGHWTSIKDYMHFSLTGR